VSDVLLANLLSPIVLAFVLGIFARLIGSDLRMPEALYTSLAIYLLFALGLKGGVALSQAPFDTLLLPALVTIALGCITPVTSYAVLRRLGRFERSDAAALAAHYGSVSAVTFIAAQSFVKTVGAPAEGYMPTLLALLESPGIAIGLGIGVLRSSNGRRVSDTMHEILTGRAMILLVGGLAVGCIAGVDGWASVAPFFESGFQGALTLFLLEMGMLTADRLGDLRRVGAFLAGFGVAMPLFHGTLGAWLGTLAGLSVGGATVLAAMAASASYIAAPPAARLTLPTANPTYYLTSSLAITFPFNVIVGIPLYYEMALWLQN
jgi:hypothetical protein